MDALDQFPAEIETIIQVGDLGVWPEYNWNIPIPRHVYWIRGNHEYEPDIAHLTEPTEIRPNLTYLPPGWVQEFDGRLVGFLGGGDSVDMPYRTEGKDWWHTEVVTSEAVDRLAWAGNLDLLVTHVPPISAVTALWGYKGGVSDYRVEQAWEQAGRPPLVCGHMHDSRILGQIRVLDIGEVVLV